MPKYEVSLAREETTVYLIEVEAENESDAEDKAWDEFNNDTSYLDHGKLVHANEYIDYVENIEDQNKEEEENA